MDALIYPTLAATAMIDAEPAYYVCSATGQNITPCIRYSEWNALCTGAEIVDTYNTHGEYLGTLQRICDKLYPSDKPN